VASRKLQVEIVGDSSSLERAFGRSSRAGSTFGSVMGRSVRGAAIAVGAAFAGMGAVVAAGVKEISDSQKVAAQTAAVLKSTGGSANVTAREIDNLANSLSNMSGVDDELVGSGANLLLTFTNIRNEAGKGNDVFNQTTRAVLDMSVAMGQDMKSSAILAGKALNDPIRGLTALRRVGVAFTDAQEKQIKTMVKAGDTMGAQKVILAELNKEFGGSAKAAGDTLPGQLNKLRKSFDDVAGQVASGLVPVLSRAAEGAADFLKRFSEAEGASAKFRVAADEISKRAKQIWTAFSDAVKEIDWAAVATTIAIGLSSVSGKIRDGIVRAFEGINWQTTGQAIIDGISNALKTAGELAKSLANTILAAAREIDWELVGRIVGPGLATAVAVAITTFLDPAFWVRNWDLALAIALTAFRVKIFEFAGNALRALAAPLAKLGGDMVGVIARGIGSFSPTLAAAFTTVITFAVQTLGRILPGLWGIVERLATALWNRLPGILRAILTVGWVAALASAISAVAGAIRDKAVAVYNAAKDFGQGIIDKIIEILTKLPGQVTAKLGEIKGAIAGVAASAFGWAKDIGVSIINGIKAGVSDVISGAGDWLKGQAEKYIVGPLKGIVPGWGSTPYEWARDKIGKAITGGVAAGLREGAPEAFGAIRNLAGSFGRFKLADPIVAKFVTDFSRQMKSEASQIEQSGERAMTSAGRGMQRGLTDVGRTIVKYAHQYGVDAAAAVSVAWAESGLRQGAVGDAGTSFGPFQLHRGGALPTGKGQAWAESADGIAYAMRKIGDVARGLQGNDAITAIVRLFERPANPSAEIQRASGYYAQLAGTIKNVGVTAVQAGKEAARGASETGQAGAAAIRALIASRPEIEKAARMLGVGQVKEIISGILGVEQTLQQQLSQALRRASSEALSKATAAVKEARSGFAAAFSEMASSALSAFDQVTSAWKSPAGQMLADLQIAEQLRSMNDAIIQAGGAINASFDQLALPEKIKQINAEMTAAQTTGQGELASALRSKLEFLLGQQSAFEQEAHDKRQAQRRINFANELAALQAELNKHPEEYRTVGKKINALLAEFGVDQKFYGTAMGIAFKDGLNTAKPAIVQALVDILDALKRRAKLRSNAEEGPLSDLDSWFGGFGPALAASISGEPIYRKMDEISARLRVSAMEAQRQLEAAKGQVTAITAAGPAEGETEADFQARLARAKARVVEIQRQLADLEYQQKEAQLTKKAEQQRRHWEAGHTIDRENFQRKLTALETQFILEGAKQSDIQKRLVAILRSHGIHWEDTGAILGKRFADGIRAAQDQVAKAADLLAQTAARALGAAQAAVGNIRVTAKEIQGRQHGGPVRRNTPYIVGEGGQPELFIPGQSGRIAPAGATMTAVTGGGGDVYVTVNAPNYVGSTNELADAVRRSLFELARRNGGSALPGVA
jgi:hypothetical protein